MADEIGQFEISDNQGSTASFSGTATTTPANVPAVAGNAISEALIVAGGENLEISFDGGTTYFKVPKKAAFTWDVKGEPTQLSVRTSIGTVGYEIILNTEVF